MKDNHHPSLHQSESVHIPFYRNVTVVNILMQLLFFLFFGILAFWLLRNMFAGLAQQNLRIQFGFMSEEAGFSISEGIAFSSENSYWRAFQVGAVNTLRVSLLGILLSTILGIFIGVGRLSHNFLINALSTAYVEIIRNIPLLVQLFVWYHVVYLALPGIRQSIPLPGEIHLSNRGVFFPWGERTDTTGMWLGFIILAVMSGFGARVLMNWKEKSSGLPQSKTFIPCLTFFGVALLSLFVLPEFPFRLSIPRLKGFNFQGGIHFSPEFLGLLTGLTIYTAAFIAEIVRAGILAVHRGQSEAAKALGLAPLQIFRLVIFPQALRVIFPPLANQYLNLTKNSSLALVIGFADLFQVSQTISNQSGNAIPIILLIMGSYLGVSLFISIMINWFNARTGIITK
ncbi:MAG: amino acid ABC transporter permease [Nitrospiria bacterium]